MGSLSMSGAIDPRRNLGGLAPPLPPPLTAGDGVVIAVVVLGPADVVDGDLGDEDPPLIFTIVIAVSVAADTAEVVSASSLIELEPTFGSSGGGGTVHEALPE